MQAIVIDGPGAVRLAEVRKPEPERGWARVRVEATGICATDFEVLKGSIRAEYPLTPGHEWSGVVDAVGGAGDGKWLGQRVTGDNEITCLECSYCRRGEWRRCREYRQIGFAAPGAYAEWVLVPVRNLHGLAEAVSFEQGALLEPLGVGLAVAEAAGGRIGTTAVVLGTGPIGLNSLAALKAAGAARILCLERRAWRRELARAWGAAEVFEDAGALEEAAGRLHAEGTDVVVDATGQAEMLELGLRVVRFGGVLVLAGYFGGAQVRVRPDVIGERNLRVVGAGNNSGFIGRAARAAAEGTLRTESMITHRFGLEDWETFLDPSFIAREGLIKAIIRRSE